MLAHLDAAARAREDLHPALARQRLGDDDALVAALVVHLFFRVCCVVCAAGVSGGGAEV